MSKIDNDVVIIEADERGGHMETTSDERLLAMLIYVTSFFTTIIGPIIIWLLKRDESSFIDYHGKVYLNFVISYFVYGIVETISIVLIIVILLVSLVDVIVVVFKFFVVF